jgi:hypothetical protein
MPVVIPPVVEQTWRARVSHCSPFLRFNLVFAASLVTLLALGGSGLWLLDQLGRLPAPPVTATNCIDEKFGFVREHAGDAPRLIAVGSSVTWRNLDFSVLSKADLAALRPLNAAPCFLRVNETATLTRFYLDNMPSVKVVLSVFAMRDFEACEGDGAFFDPAATRRYMFGGWPGWPLYFQNFRPLLFLEDVWRMPGMRSGADASRSLAMDRWGSSPVMLTPPSTRGDVATNAQCFAHLDRARRDIADRNVRWIVVLLPPMPAWLDAYDRDGERDRAWRAEIARRLAGSDVTLLDGDGRLPVKDSDFTDPAHFHWSTVPAFTRWIFSQATLPGEPAS